MQGTVPTKIGRVVGNLISHPEYLARCVMHNLLTSRTPLELELPWFSYAAIDFLAGHLRPDQTVCEYGSGGSTVFFARRVKWVHSIEDNSAWFDLVSKKVQQQGLTNVSLKLCPFDFKAAAGFEQSAYLNAMPTGPFDVIVVDGSEEWIQVRPACFEQAEHHVKPGGIIVLDDSWRYPQLREKNHARRFEIFQSVGPYRPGVTSTDVFFY